MKPRFRGAVFDMDGTLVSSESLYREAWRRAAQETELAMTDADYDRMMGLNRQDTLVMLSGLWAAPATAERYLAATERHYDELAATRGHQVRDGIPHLLRTLRTRQVPLAVATSSHRALAESTLNAVGLREFFVALVAGEEVCRGKPDPEIFATAAERLGVPAAECVAFEDSAAGAASAAAAGMTVVLIPESGFAAPPSLPGVRLYRHHAEALPLFSSP